MARSDPPEPEIVPSDDGQLANRSRVRALLDRVKLESPRTLLGAPLLQELASKLNIRRRAGVPEVTQMRLALRVR